MQSGKVKIREVSGGLNKCIRCLNAEVDKREQSVMVQRRRIKP